MPVQSCESNGSPGWRWGDTGKCYTYTAGDDSGSAEAKRKAFVQGYAAGETQKMAPEEIEAARAISDFHGIEITKDANDSTGLMIAWYPYRGDGGAGDKLAAELMQIVPNGGTAIEDLHLTIAYLGEAADYDVDLVAACTKLFTNDHWGFTQARVGGLGRFVGEGTQDVIVALIDSEEIACLRANLLDRLCYAGVYVPNTGHGFIPHITLAYVDRSTPQPSALTETYDFQIDALTVRAAGQSVTFPFRSLVDAGMPEDSYSSPAGPYYKAAQIIAHETLNLPPEHFELAAAAVASIESLAAVADELADPAEVAEKRALAAAEATRKRALAAEDAILAADSEELRYTTIKAAGNEKRRYTFGPLYAPARMDAHGEFTDEDNLEQAVWDYVRASADNGRRINLQHDDSGDATVGEWVNIVSWPYETTIKVAVPGEAERELVMPANTVYMGVIWDEKAWDEGIETGLLKGFSLGGRAIKVSSTEELDAMGDWTRKATKKPYGDVTYADPGYQDDGQARYPIDTEEHVRAAWSYINQADNAAKYTADELKKVKAKIKSAAQKFGIEIAKEADPAPAPEIRINLDEIRRAAEADAQRFQEALAEANGRADEYQSLTLKVLDALRAVGEATPAAIHVHVPDTVLNIGSKTPPADS